MTDLRGWIVVRASDLELIEPHEQDVLHRQTVVVPAELENKSGQPYSDEYAILDCGTPESAAMMAQHFGASSFELKLYACICSVCAKPTILVERHWSRQVSRKRSELHHQHIVYRCLHCQSMIQEVRGGTRYG